ncbi:MAG: amidohydrolase family protein [Chitinophagaceae bacterium]|nr:amidohydrolase family protein [Chitinophagaceae bacterium]
MGIKKFSADRIFDGYRFLTNKVLITDDTGRVEAIVNTDEAGDDIRHEKGILTPGFINGHCHLELSHLKNVIPPGTGLIEFLCSVVTKRDFPEEQIQDAIIRAEQEMHNNGIVAVGDIGNTADTAEVKAKSKIYWHNFVEVISFTDDKAEENLLHYEQVARQMKTALANSPQKNRTVLTPHAPYSISPKTFKILNEKTEHATISLHNQEHPAEDELYKYGGGEYLRLFRIFGVHESPFPVTGLSSIRSVLPNFNRGQTIFLVHNTYMPEEDILWANQYAQTNHLKLVYCFCINANLYIEGRTPPVHLFHKHNCHIVLGTDSYSSNWQLSIPAELQTFKKHFPELADETLLQWATLNGARALQWDNELGSFEKGKTPGIVLLSDDFSRAERLS